MTNNVHTDKPVDRMELRYKLMRKGDKKLIAIWIVIILVTQVVANLLVKNGMVIPPYIELAVLAFAVFPLIILLFRVLKDKNVKTVYRFFAGYFFFVACIGFMALAKEVLNEL